VSSRTFEVDIIDGRIQPTLNDPVPTRGHGFLTIIENAPPKAEANKDSNLRDFISAPDFPLSEEQFRISMEADFWEQ
jgi:hypothetical protein